MKKYVLITKKDYQDEFSYPIVSLFTEVEFEKVINKIDEIDDEWEDEIYFGTNEYFEISKNEVKDMILSSQIVSEEEFITLKKFKIYGFNIVEYILDDF